MTKTIDKEILRHFHGTENWYRRGIARNVLYTDGAKYVPETAEAYWLLDEIAFSQMVKRVAAEEFQLWKLKVNLKEQTAKLVCEDGNGHTVFRKRIPYTDFPLEEISFYFTNNVIHLPSEY
ncbi:MAG: hypothetical protein PHS80_02785 [Methanothrix sp.]|jgi:hypothetical protein|nr:hypothetical protein [Methanothrix sp.]MDD4447682.1 hypothetical protein [Methanothrix sp.]